MRETKLEETCLNNNIMYFRAGEDELPDNTHTNEYS